MKDSLELSKFNELSENELSEVNGGAWSFATLFSNTIPTLVSSATGIISNAVYGILNLFGIF
ncbi:MAG: bacteriocin [Clostridiales bacterium]|nr:bacteriocin [Clostridiales bacterium]